MTEMSAEYRAQMYLGVEKLRALESHGLAVVDARRLGALERLERAAREFTSTWGRSKGGMLWREEEPPGAATILFEALEAILE